MIKNKIIIGSRGSKLAILYAEKAKETILDNNVDLNKDSVDIKIIKTLNCGALLKKLVPIMVVGYKAEIN
jgi:porphobilinogen deaminase